MILNERDCQDMEWRYVTGEQETVTCYGAHVMKLCDWGAGKSDLLWCTCDEVM